VMAELKPVQFTDDWRADIRAALHDMRALIFRHPWTASLHATRPSIGPHTLAFDGPFVDRLTQAGFKGADLDHGWWMLVDYVIGTTATQIKWDGWLSGNAADLEAVRSYAWNAIAEYPSYSDYVQTYLLPTDPAEVRVGRFEFGLDCLLDGLAARLEHL
jgi:Tetracyclin repressor-like, C-terminal domain